MNYINGMFLLKFHGRLYSRHSTRLDSWLDNKPLPHVKLYNRLTNGIFLILDQKLHDRLHFMLYTNIKKTL